MSKLKVCFSWTGWTSTLIFLNISESYSSPGLNQCSRGFIKEVLGMNCEAKVNHWSQRENYTTILCFYGLCVHSWSQTITQLWNSVAAHPRPHKVTALVPEPPFTSFFLDMSLWKIFQRHVSIWHCFCSSRPTSSNREWIHCVQASPGASDCKLCRMQMAVSVAIHPQLLGILPALTATK